MFAHHPTLSVGSRSTVETAVVPSRCAKESHILHDQSSNLFAEVNCVVRVAKSRSTHSCSGRPLSWQRALGSLPT